MGVGGGLFKPLIVSERAVLASDDKRGMCSDFRLLVQFLAWRRTTADWHSVKGSWFSLWFFQSIS